MHTLRCSWKGGNKAARKFPMCSIMLAARSSRQGKLNYKHKALYERALCHDKAAPYASVNVPTPTKSWTLTSDAYTASSPRVTLDIAQASTTP